MSPRFQTNLKQTNTMTNTMTNNCTFTDFKTNARFSLTFPYRCLISDMYDALRPNILTPFDLIHKSEGITGQSLNKNHRICTNIHKEFYIRTYHTSECFICLDYGSIVQIPLCNHSICINCYIKLNKCPFCRNPLHTL